MPGGSLRVELAGLGLRNPVILAAGTAGYLNEMDEVLPLSRVGAVVTKSITLRPREGNATWRIIESRAGMLNAIGLANVGLEHFVEHMAARVAAVPCGVIGSIAGFSVDDYVQVAAAMDDIEALAAVEINVSCPNVRGGVEFGCDPGALRELMLTLRPVLAHKPMLVKLSPLAVATPGFTMVESARMAIDPAGSGPGVRGGPNGRAGADALSIANTTPAMAIDVRTRRPRLANVTGGLSGPGVHPMVVKLIHDVYRGVARDAGVPLVGIGGVLRWEDAAEFVLAGASAVQMGTALFADPRSPLRVVKGLEKWVKKQGVGSIGELVGKVEA